MSLGKTIYRLRSERNLSQGDLANLLNVSRQSVSRWENDSAVPELDKLVKLSEVFEVTLDELVTGVRPEPAVDTPSQSDRSTGRQRGYNGFSTRKMAELILLCMAFLVTLACTMLGSFLTGVIFASPFLICATICLTPWRHPGLWCGWAVSFIVDLYLRYATGINWRLTRFTLSYEPSMNYVRLVVAWCQLLCILLLVVLTIYAFRNVRVTLTSQKRACLIGGWVLLAVVNLPLPIQLSGMWYYFMAVVDLLRLGLLTLLLIVTISVLRQKKG